MQQWNSESSVRRVKQLFKVILVLSVVFIICIVLNDKWTYIQRLLAWTNKAYIWSASSTPIQFSIVNNSFNNRNDIGAMHHDKLHQVYKSLSLMKDELGAWRNINVTPARLKQTESEASRTSFSAAAPTVNRASGTNFRLTTPSAESRVHIIDFSHPTQRPTSCNNCFHHDFHYVITNDKICHVSSPDDVIDLLIVITTAHSHFDSRQALRSTWLTYSRNNTAHVRYVFLLGETDDHQLQNDVKLENELFHDILKEDFVDSYSNLTLKTIMGFKWAVTQCSRARHVMKTDDDMYVNIENLLKALASVGSHMQNTVMGACILAAEPHRNKQSKWYASEMSYPERSYPGFCSGTGYVTGMNVVENVYNISPSVPFFHLEDIYVALCIRKLAFKLKSYPGFHMDLQLLHPCVYKGIELITSHGLSSSMLTRVWQQECDEKLV